MKHFLKKAFISIKPFFQKSLSFNKASPCPIGQFPNSWDVLKLCSHKLLVGTWSPLEHIIWKFNPVIGWVGKVLHMKNKEFHICKIWCSNYPVSIFESINTREWTRWIHIQLNQTASTSYDMIIYDMIHIWCYIYPQTQISIEHQRID